MEDNRPLPQTEDESGQFSDEWLEQAEKAAERFKIPMAGEDVVGSPEEAEQRLRDFEQEGGE